MFYKTTSCWTQVPEIQTGWRSLLPGCERGVKDFLLQLNIQFVFWLQSNYKLNLMVVGSSDSLHEEKVKCIFGPALPGFYNV